MKNRILLISLILVALVIFLISVSIGHFSIDIPTIIDVLIGNREGISINTISILTNVRIPRAIGALVIGMALSSSGAAYQSVFRNPIVSPDILGAASGAACGAALGMLLALPEGEIQILAFIVGLIAVGITYGISKVVGKGRSMLIYLVLIGMIISSLFSSLISIMKYFADVNDTLPAITFWLMGSLSNVTNSQLIVVVPIILIGIIGLNIYSWKLNLMSFGENEAMSMGVNMKRDRGIIIVLSTLISSAAISICGLVGWVGIIIPHITRMLVGANYRYMLPICTILGGIYMMIIDNIARNLLFVEIPLGILTAIIGAPIFIYILFHSEFASNKE